MGELGLDSIPVAVKILPLSDRNTHQELGALRKIGASHHNVVEVYPPILSPHSSHVHLPMELCDGTLLDYVERNGGLEEEAAKPIFRDVVAGLLFLHKQGIHHLDVKPDNILMKDGVPKLADFGMALGTEDALVAAVQAKKPYGTTRYASPECIDAKHFFELEQSVSKRLSRGERVSVSERRELRDRSVSVHALPYDPEKADVWALGITMFAEVTGVYPWNMASLDTHFYRQCRGSGSAATRCTLMPRICPHLRWMQCGSMLLAA